MSIIKEKQDINQLLVPLVDVGSGLSMRSAACAFIVKFVRRLRHSKISLFVARFAHEKKHLPTNAAYAL
jgi:hypothetical protein